MTTAEKGLLTKQEVEKFMDRWLNDPTFVSQLKADPKAALKSCDIKPDKNIIEALSSIDPGTPVEELQKRISKKGLTPIVIHK